MATYLVTGAAGFIGARVAELLLEDGHSVVSIDNLNDYYDVRLKDYRLSRLLGDESWKPGNSPRASRYSQSSLVQRGNFTFEEIDIEDSAALERLFTTYTFDAVFNLLRSFASARVACQRNRSEAGTESARWALAK